MADSYMKRHSTSLIIREMQVKSTVKCHLIPARMATITSVGKDVETLQCSHSDGGKVE